MRISRVSIRTLDAADLPKATAFYHCTGDTLARVSPVISFFELKGTWLARCPMDKLAEDIAPAIRVATKGFSGATLANNADSKDDGIAFMELAASLAVSKKRSSQGGQILALRLIPRHCGVG